MVRKFLIAVLSTAAFGIAVPAAQAGGHHHKRCHHAHVRPAPKPKHKRCHHHKPPPKHHRRPCKKQQRPSVTVITRVSVNVTTTVFVQ